MIFRYGAHDFHTMERAEETCYLLTNGLGGFSSATMAGSRARSDHALLMACIKAPNHRYCMVSRLSESLLAGSRAYWISSQRFAGNEEMEEDGYLQQISFSYEDVPEWKYMAGGVELTKTIAMLQGSNTVAVTYRIRNDGMETGYFTVTPYFQFVKKGEALTGNQEFRQETGAVYSKDLAVYYRTDGLVQETDCRYETEVYTYDACDGRRASGMSAAIHHIRWEIEAQSERLFELIYSTEPDIIKHGMSASHVITQMRSYRQKLDETAGFRLPAAKMLTKSANQFVARRESTGGDTILAGYPFFEDWGRDTMIALPGCTLATKQFETAKSILRTFMTNEKRGLMPNLFPEGEQEPAYNTADAALLFINCVYLYYEKTQDLAFVEESYPVMERIITWYCQGTDFGIHMDQDGLIEAGQLLDQVTWMDVRVGDILPTPRHGKPVEINAYWYNALRIMALFASLTGREPDLNYRSMADLARESFKNQFWMEEKSCLKDVLSGTTADVQIRCNQIWAVSMPFTMLSEEQEKQVVRVVMENLYTPYGLRTLNQDDRQFHPWYGGPQLARDMAYHQGTVWTFPLGAYYLAYLKVHGYSKRARDTVKEQLDVMGCAMREGCAGQLPEIYDGAYPSASKGCFAQAWSVGEILRVYEALEQSEDRSEAYGA